MIKPSLVRSSIPFQAAALCLAPSVTHASYYVSDSATVSSQAGTTLVAGNPDLGVAAFDSHTYNSGNLFQTSVFNSTSSNVIGSSYSFDYTNPVLLSQSARSNIEDTATIGALHVTLSSYSNTGTDGVVHYNSGDAQSRASDTVVWSDNITFYSPTPGGSDFILSLTLDDAIDVTGAFAANETGFFSGQAVARLYVTNTANMTFVPYPLLAVVDSHAINSNPTLNVNSPPPSNTVSFTLHVNSYASGTFMSELDSYANAVEGDGQSLVNAGDTALFTIYSPDPNAYYTTDSGTLFATSVPEPASLTLLALTPLLLPRRRRAI
jgi:hypothetical protein